MLGVFIFLKMKEILLQMLWFWKFNLDRAICHWLNTYQNFSVHPCVNSVCTYLGALGISLQLVLFDEGDEIWAVHLLTDDVSSLGKSLRCCGFKVFKGLFSSGLGLIFSVQWVEICSIWSLMLNICRELLFVILYWGQFVYQEQWYHGK